MHRVALSLVFRPLRANPFGTLHHRLQPMQRFKHRNKIGLDVALEALKDVRAKRQATADELWRYVELCRVANVMRPYLEAIA